MATRTPKGPATGPIKRKGPQKRRGNPTKGGKIFGNWYKRKGGK